MRPTFDLTEDYLEDDMPVLTPAEIEEIMAECNTQDDIREAAQAEYDAQHHDYDSLADLDWM